jgi:alpha-ketoglutarate-dependent taurine dioxygenase
MKNIDFLPFLKMDPFGALIQAKTLPSMKKILGLLSQEKLVLIRGLAPLTKENFLAFCRGADRQRDALLHWDFGPVMELRVEKNAKNYLFSHEPVPFHWDGAFHRVPSTLIFNCITAPGPATGGETLFCDTEKVLQKTHEETKADWDRIRLTYRTQKVAHYGGEFTTPLVVDHPRRSGKVLRFAEEVKTELNPVSLEVSGVDSENANKTVSFLSQRIYQEDVCLEHRWHEGDLLLVDNHAILHARRSFIQETPRHIRRIQLL